MIGFLDNVGFLAASNGTGDFTVSTVLTGYRLPSAAGAKDGISYRYRAFSSDQSQWEIGYGAYTVASTTIARTTIVCNSAGTTSAISFTNAPNVIFTLLSGDLNSDVVTSLAELAKIDTTKTTLVYVSQDGIEGLFAWRSGDLSASVSADTRSGVYVAANGIASTSGAWRRVFNGSVYNVKWFGAVGDNSSDDYAAIQGALTFIVSAGGGELFFPIGGYYTSTGITVAGSVKLRGSGRDQTVINGKNNSIDTVTFTGGSYAGLEAISVYGDQRSTVTSHYPVVVNTDIAVIFRDVNIWGGFYGLYTAGVDGRYDDCFISGMGTSGGCVFSTGANYYTNCKFDDYTTQSHNYTFWQQSTSLMENQFTSCDFSANSTFSFVVSDPSTAYSRTKFTGACVFSAKVSLARSQWTLFNGCELGGGTGFWTIASTAAVVTIANCYAQSPCSASGGGAMYVSNNYNVS